MISPFSPVKGAGWQHDFLTDCGRGAGSAVHPVLLLGVADLALAARSKPGPRESPFSRVFLKFFPLFSLPLSLQMVIAGLLFCALS